MLRDRQRRLKTSYPSAESKDRPDIGFAVQVLRDRPQVVLVLWKARPCPLEHVCFIERVVPYPRAVTPAIDLQGIAPVAAQSARSAALKQTRGSPATAASRRWKRAQAASNATASIAAVTASSTARSTGSRSHKAATTLRRARISSASKRRERAGAKRSAASNDNSPASSSTH